MALTIARDWRDSDAVALTDVEILRPLVFAPGSSREILCRISSPTSTFEIMSRPRLSASPYVLHARGGVIDKLGAAEDRFNSAELGDWREGDALYALGVDFRARVRSGLSPALESTARWRRDRGQIVLAFRGRALWSRSRSPVFLFPGLILLFEDLGRERIAYLPVRFDEIQLIKPGAELAQARLRIRRADEREIVADYELFDDCGRAIARLSGARYQPARSRPAATLLQAGLVESWIPATGKLAGAAPAFEAAFQRRASVGDAGRTRCGADADRRLGERGRS